MAGILYHQYQALNELNRTLRVLTRAGFGPTTLPYQSVRNMFYDQLTKMGLRAPKATTLLKLISALSPGSIALYMDAETGWFTESKITPGSTPVYKHVSDDVAIAILRDEITHELEDDLMDPDLYEGE